MLIGMFIGFSSADEEFVEPMPWAVLLFLLPTAFIILFLFMFTVLVTCTERVYGFIYWGIWLFTFFALACGIGMAAQSLYIGGLSPQYLFVFVGSLGYLLCLLVIPRFAKWRYERAH